MICGVPCGQGCLCRNPPKATGEDAFDFCQHGFAEGPSLRRFAKHHYEACVVVWTPLAMLTCGVPCGQGCLCRNPPKATGEDAFGFCQHGFAEGPALRRIAKHHDEACVVVWMPLATLTCGVPCGQGCLCRNPPKATGEDAFDFCQHGFAEGPALRRFVKHHEETCIEWCERYCPR